MKLKVVSDGTVSGTTVLDADTGAALSNVTAVTWHIDTESITADVVLEMRAIPVDLIATVKTEDDVATKKRLDELAKPL